ncbi:uncharacterized protein BXZ73DRAFT_103608 [Epithele typhae]|uniref:uncharacterized protein n=1 Tax=Epithele typhae TaxID=378194 RepID=UPI002007A031|nr:uncharacterized protein BXZ73DRAFT_103608 [Epithele typhae]KAH9924319.1 hypothetical protein BXZ73DRAFT_103608 [Epithele typhae]
MTNAAGNKRKRTLTLANGDDVDLTVKISTCDEDIVEAMRLRIIELEDQVAEALPAAKRQKTNAGKAQPVSEAPPAASGSKTAAAPAMSKADEKKLKAQIKKLFDGLKKQCKSADCKFQGSRKSVKLDEVLEKDEFDAIFKTGDGELGTLIQPTPTNKPTSTVTIIEYSGADARDLLTNGGANLGQLKGTRWSIGGGRSFRKSEKLGACDVEIDFLEVQYSRNTMKCTLKFEVSEVGTCGAVYGASHKSRGFGGFGMNRGFFF